jgi:polyisoprenyl-phosphate glycosyltransferase
LPSERLWLVSPVFFDVESYSKLRENARAALAGSPELEIRFVAIDDSAGADAAIRTLESATAQTVIAPPFPLGHQRALVFGLRRLSTVVDERDLLVTLDADGEDKPEDLIRLLAPLREAGASLRTVAVAARTRRRESPSFKAFYVLFKFFFRSLTGTVILSGNYAAYRGWLTRNVLFHPHFDLAYSSSLLSLGLHVRRVPCERGLRYAGASKMTYLKLIQHGLRMLMPFADRIATRGLIMLACLLCLSLLAIAVLLGLSVGGYYLPPGWLVYTLCTGTLLCALGATGMVIVFALFVQSQSMSLAQLDAGLREREVDPPAGSSPPAV